MKLSTIEILAKLGGIRWTRVSVLPKITYLTQCFICDDICFCKLFATVIDVDYKSQCCLVSVSHFQKTAYSSSFHYFDGNKPRIVSFDKTVPLM